MRGLNAAPISTEEAATLLEPFRDVKAFVLAVSGGPDSTAMMGLVAGVRAALGWPDASVATVDHGLRPEAAAEARATAELARSLGLAHRTLRWRGPKPETGVQEAAREARFALLVAHARKLRADGIMLAHTLDDQAETVLMRLLRGSGVAGLGGMQARSERAGVAIVRPFLGAPKARLIATCEARGWPFASDPTNRDEAYLRPRLRRLLPNLAAEGLTAERLAILSRRMEGAEAAIRSAAIDLIRTGEERARQSGEGAGAIACDVFAEAPYETAVRMVQALIGRAQPESQGGPRLEKIEALTRRLQSAIRAGRPFAGTLGTTKISCRAGLLRATAAPPRRMR